MGRSIHDVGPRLRWSDVGTIVLHLDHATSHFVRQQNPGQAHLLPYSAPQTRLMAEMVDEVTRLRWQLRGADESPTPLLQRIHQQEVAPKQKPAPRKRQTERDVRALVDAAFTN